MSTLFFADDLSGGTPGNDLSGRVTPTYTTTWTQDPGFPGSLVFDGSGSAVRSNASGFANYINAFVPTNIDYRSECDLQVQTLTGRAGPTVRDGNGVGNGVWGYLDGNLKSWVVAIIGGSTLGTVPATGLLAAVPGHTYRVALSAAGSTFTLSVGGVSAVVVSAPSVADPSFLGLGAQGLATDSTGIHLAKVSGSTGNLIPTSADAVARALLDKVIGSALVTPDGTTIGKPAVFLTLDDKPFPAQPYFVACVPGTQNVIGIQIDGAGRHIHGMTGRFTLMIVGRNAQDQAWQDTIALSAAAGNLLAMAHSVINVVSVEFLIDNLGDYLAEGPARLISESKPRRYEQDNDKSLIYRAIDLEFEVSYYLALTLSPTD